MGMSRTWKLHITQNSLPSSCYNSYYLYSITNSTTSPCNQLEYLIKSQIIEMAWLTTDSLWHWLINNLHNSTLIWAESFELLRKTVLKREVFTSFKFWLFRYFILNSFPLSAYWIVTNQVFVVPLFIKIVIANSNFLFSRWVSNDNIL